MSTADRDKWNGRYREGAYAERGHPSALLEEWIDDVPEGLALDVACGAGRNALYLAERGFAVDAVDISGEALARARESADKRGVRVHWIEHDLDQPLSLDAEYQLILVIRYVDLALIRHLADSLAPGGFLICEEHMVSDADVIGPTSPAYRVSPGALVEAAEGLRICHCSEGVVTEPDGRRAALSRLVAQKTQPAG